MISGPFHDDAYVTSSAGSNVTSVTGHGSSVLTFQSNSVISLAPYTEVTFSAFGNVTETSSPGTDASACVELIGQLEDLHGGYVETRSYVATDFGSTARDLSIILQSDAGPRGGNISFASTLSANVLPAVPEPATMSMLAAGLAFIGAGAWRRAGRAEVQAPSRPAAV